MIPPDVIEQVRDRTNIVTLILESVPSLKRRGRTFVGLCPFHKEKTGSFHVNPDRGFFHCFGCEETGSVIDFVMKQDGYTFPEAVRALAERAGIEIQERDYDPEERDAAARAKKQRDDFYAANALAATYWEQQLREHTQRTYALDELLRRGLVPGADATADESLQAFRIGYAPPEWEGLTNFLKAQGVSPVTAESVGLLVPNKSGSGYHDRFRHRLMFAIIDPQGRIIAFSGRALPEIPEENAEKRDPPAKYINSPESPIYTKGNALFGLYQARHTIRAAGVAVLVEGNFDVVSLHARGIQNVVAPLGTAFTTDQAKLLARYAREFVVLFDADAAGAKATRAARETLQPLDVKVKVAVLAKGKDPDDFVRERGAKALLDAVKQARGMTEYLLQSALDESFSNADAHEKAERINFVLRLVSEEKDPVVRALHEAYTNQLAGRLDIVRAGQDAFRALRVQVRKALAAVRPVASGSRIAPTRSARPAGSTERMEMCGALIEYPDLLDDPEVQSMLDLLEGLSAQIVAGVSSTRGTMREPSVLLAHIPKAIHAFAMKRIAAPVHDTIELARESFLKNGGRLRVVLVERETTEATREQERAVGDDNEAERLARDASDRHRQAR
jgi:DNA primase